MFAPRSTKGSPKLDAGPRPPWEGHARRAESGAGRSALPHRLAERGRRYAEVASRCGEAAMPRDREEGVQCVEGGEGRRLHFCTYRRQSRRSWSQSCQSRSWRWSWSRRLPRWSRHPPRRSRRSVGPLALVEPVEPLEELPHAAANPAAAAHPKITLIRMFLAPLEPPTSIVGRACQTSHAAGSS